MLRTWTIHPPSIVRTRAAGSSQTRRVADGTGNGYLFGYGEGMHSRLFGNGYGDGHQFGDGYGNGNGMGGGMSGQYGRSGADGLSISWEELC